MNKNTPIVGNEKNKEVVKSFLKPQKSISRLVFDFIVKEKVLESDNRKEKFEKLLKLVKKDFPESKFQKTHFFWYVSRANKQKMNNLGMTHLVTIPKVEKVVEVVKTTKTPKTSKTKVK